MGLFFDLFQQSQISSQRERSSTIEQRVTHVENDLRRTEKLLHTLIERLEKHVGTDLNQDGRVG